MLLLLDIDGVMLQAAPWKPVQKLQDGFFEFSPKAVNSLQKIISETGASIVLTTSHKSTYTTLQWKKIFKQRGINVSSISRLQDNKHFLNRKDEILNWRKRNKNIEHFVIIDDDKSLNGLPVELKQKVVLTQSMIGLTDADAENAIDILKNSQHLHTIKAS